MSCSLFFFSCSADHRDLHSFPTRRSSDLGVLAGRIEWRGRGVPQACHLPPARVEALFVQVCEAVGLAETRDLREQRSEEHTSELQSHVNLVCRLLLEKKKKKTTTEINNKL